jgi:hypothetical protein
MKGSEAIGRAYASQMRSKGEKVLYKVQSSDEDRGGPEDHAEDAATEELAAEQPAT